MTDEIVTKIVEGWDELCRVTGLSRGTIEKYRRVHPLPFDERIRIGKNTRIRVKRETVRRWLEELKQIEYDGD